MITSSKISMGYVILPFIAVLTSCGEPGRKSNDEIAVPRTAAKECNFPNSLAVSMKVDGDVAAIEIANRSQSGEISLQDLQGFSREHGPRGGIWIAVSESGRLISETDLSPDGWWTVEFLSSEIYNDEDNFQLSPNESKIISISWRDIVFGLDDETDKFDRHLSDNYKYRLRTSIDDADGSVNLCETGWF